MRKCWLLLFSLAACSPYSFSKEVTAISTGVDQMSDAFATGLAGLASDRAATQQFDLDAARAKVAMTSTCFRPGAKSGPDQVPCEIVQIRGKQPELTRIEMTRQKTMADLAVVKNYANALAAVTNAADRAAYNAAITQLAAAVQTLARSAGTAAPAAATIAPAVVNALGWVFGTVLDQQRFDSLKEAVNAVGTPGSSGTAPFDTVVMTLGSGLVALSEYRQAALGEEATDRLSHLGPSMSAAAYKQSMAEATAIVSALDSLRQADAAATADALVKAHKALVAAVNDPSRSFPDLVHAVGEFATQAAALRAAFGARPSAGGAASN